MSSAPLQAVRRFACSLNCGDWPVDRQSSWLVVKIGQELSWSKGQGEVTDLATKVFEKVEGEGVSVYEVSSDLEEAAAASAVAMGAGNTPDRFGLVRMSMNELLKEGVKIVHTPGTTGVPWIDEHHWDLFAPMSTYIGLTKKILKGQVDGRDRVRLLHVYQLEAQLELIQEMSADIQDEETRSALQETISKKLAQCKKKVDQERKREAAERARQQEAAQKAQPRP